MSNKNFKKISITQGWGNEVPFSKYLSENKDLLEQLLEDVDVYLPYNLNDQWIKIHHQYSIKNVGTPDIVITYREKPVVFIEIQKGRQDHIHTAKMASYANYLSCYTGILLVEKPNETLFSYISSDDFPSRLGLSVAVINITQHIPSSDTNTEFTEVFKKSPSFSNVNTTQSGVSLIEDIDYDGEYSIFELCNVTKGLIYTPKFKPTDGKTALSASGKLITFDENSNIEDVQYYVLRNKGVGGSQFANRSEDNDVIQTRFLFKGTYDECIQYKKDNNLKFQGVREINIK